MPDAKSFHMSPEEFRRQGHAVVDWIADYHVPRRELPGFVARAAGRNPLASCRRALRSRAKPSTRFSATSSASFFPASRTGSRPISTPTFRRTPRGRQFSAICFPPDWACRACSGRPARPARNLKRMCSTGWSPCWACRRNFFPTSSGGGVIQDTASSASLCALLAARERATQFASNRRGCDGRWSAYCSTQTHSSVEKAMKIAGMGSDNLRQIEVDQNFAMRPEALARQIESDIKAGLIPCFVCATVGTTSSCAIDPVREIARICRDHNLWLHVDSAMSGTAALCPEFRFIHDGVEFADSYTFNPHKWMFTNFDCNCLLRRRPEASDPDAFGVAGVPAQPGHGIGRGHRLSRLAHSARAPFSLAQALVCDPALRDRRTAAPHSRARAAGPAIRRMGACRFALRTRRARPAQPRLLPPALGRSKPIRLLMDRLNGSGDLYLTHTKLDGKFTLRLCVGQTNTQARHVERAWQRIQQETAKLLGEIPDDCRLRSNAMSRGKFRRAESCFGRFPESGTLP